MAQLIFQIPDAQMQDVIDAWGEGYDIGKQGNETQTQYAKRQIATAIKMRVKTFQGKQIPEIDVQH